MIYAVINLQAVGFTQLLLMMEREGAEKEILVLLQHFILDQLKLRRKCFEIGRIFRNYFP